MHIYLNSPRAFWKIPDTDIILTRESPISEVTSSDIEALSEDQKRVLTQSIENGVVSKVAKTFVPNKDNLEEKILKLPVSEIHRRYVSSFIMSKNLDSIQTLLKLEESSKKVRPNLIKILNSAAAAILDADPEIKYKQEIEEAVEEIEGVIVQSKPAKKPTRKGRGRPRKVAGDSN